MANVSNKEKVFSSLFLFVIIMIISSCSIFEDFSKEKCKSDYFSRPFNSGTIDGHITIKEDFDILITADKEWESRTINYATILKRNNKWELWYESYPKNSEIDFGSYICYAYSFNGIDWIKPELDLFYFNGSKTNIILNGLKTGGVHGPSVIYDGDSYKMLFVGEDYKLFGSSSKNGIDWTAPIKLNNGYGYDTQNSLHYDSINKEYIIYHRFWENDYRTIRYITSEFFFDFSQSLKQEVFKNNNSTSSKKNLHIYNPAISFYNDNIYSFPSIYNTDCRTLEPIFCFAKNGEKLNCNFQEPIIKLKDVKHTGINQIYVLPNSLINDNNQLYLFYMVKRNKHSSNTEKTSYDGEIRRAKVNLKL